MQIKIVTVGKLKEKYLVMGINEYLKRLTAYAKVEIIEVSDEKTPDKASEADEEIIKTKEAERIERHIKDGTFLVPLVIEGKMLTSKDLADKLSSLALTGKSDVTFVIGGSLGLHQRIINRGDLLLSFSKMTFPHQLMRLILLEQVYRAFKIIRGEPYHK